MTDFEHIAELPGMITYDTNADVFRKKTEFGSDAELMVELADAALRGCDEKVERLLWIIEKFDRWARTTGFPYMAPTLASITTLYEQKYLDAKKTRQQMKATAEEVWHKAKLDTVMPDAEEADRLRTIKQENAEDAGAWDL